LVKPFSPPPVLSSYRCWIELDLEKLTDVLTLSEDERQFAEKWNTHFVEIRWEKWNGGYERWVVQAMPWGEMGTQWEYCRWPGKDTAPGVVWRGSLGAKENSWHTDYPQIEIVILPELIRVGAKYGRFGAGTQTNDNRVGLFAMIPPKPEWVLAQIPTTEARLAQYEEPREEPKWWEPVHGRPEQKYELDDKEKGVTWWLYARHDMRPLVCGKVIQCYSGASGHGQVLSLSLSFPRIAAPDRLPAGLADDSPVEIMQYFSNENWVSEGDRVWAVFSDHGEIDYLWPEAEISRQAMGKRQMA
jgi:hypothetical protein